MSDATTETGEDQTLVDEHGNLKFMQQVIGLDYAIRVSPLSIDFGRKLNDGTITGHRCPQCGLVYVPPRGFCPICVIETTAKDEVTIADRGAVTSWTVLTPIQYHGQKERDDYALASILLDGASGTIGQQRLLDVALDDIRMGMRVEAVWADPADRAGEPDARGWGFGSAIKGWRPTGEPDADEASFKDHVL
jgi:uncharacterized OB-fold protein